jgi:hypothetical protein
MIMSRPLMGSRSPRWFVPSWIWKEQRTIGEFDGKIKYGRLLKPGQSIEEVLFEEKRREDALRDLGWQIVRWLWADIYRCYSRSCAASLRTGHLPVTSRHLPALRVKPN